MSEEATPSAAGDRLGGRYRLVEPLATGGMAVVWEAQDEVLHRAVAVKLLAGTPDPDARARIRAEALAVARLSHPNITNVFDYGESGGTPYVVMELLDGHTLSQRLTGGPLDWHEVAQIAAEVAAALAAAHAHGIVHRDIKPANVMLTDSGAKVLDFGIAGLVGSTDDADPDAPLLGTPGYLSPERLDGRPLTEATDVYALGMLIYRSLVGRLPWTAETVTQMLQAQVFAEPEPLPADVGAPAELVHLVGLCLTRVPQARPESAMVAARLARIAGVSVVLPKAGVRRGMPPVLALETVTPGGSRSDVPSQPDVLIAVPVADGRADDRRRFLVRLAAAALVSGAVAATVIAYASRDGAERNSAAAARPSASAGRITCWVDLVTRDEPGTAFTGRLTLVNTGSTAYSEWIVGLHLARGEQITSAVGAESRQTGRSLQLTGDVELPAGKAVTIGFTGTGTDRGFDSPGVSVNGVPCVEQVRHIDRPDVPLPPVTGVTDPPAGVPSIMPPLPAVSGAGGERPTDPPGGGGPPTGTPNPTPNPPGPPDRSKGPKPTPSDCPGPGKSQCNSPPGQGGPAAAAACTPPGREDRVSPGRRVGYRPRICSGGGGP